MRLRRARLTLGSLSIVIVLTSCGVSAQDHAQEIDRRDVPFRLLDHPSTPSASSTTTAPVGAPVIYLVGPDDTLVAVERSAAADGSVRALRTLLRGSSDVDVASGLRSAIPPRTSIGDAHIIRDGVLVLDLDERILDVPSGDQALAFAQIVYTATEDPAVDAVRFLIAGEPAAVPTAEGTQTNGPIRREDVTPLPD